VPSFMLDSQSGIMIIPANTTGVRNVRIMNDFFITRVVYSLFIIKLILDINQWLIVNYKWSMQFPQ
jgi:hypothetical protein